MADSLVAHKCITLKAGTCNNSLLELNKSMFLDRDVLQVGFQWHTVGKEMPISRIVIAVPNATIVLLD
jgi:hypothetical protein